MATICSADCADFDLTPLPDGGCEPKIRKRNLDKLGLYLCSTTLPDPLTCENIQPLITDGGLVFTSSLVNVEWADPTFEALSIADCMAALQYPTGRQFTAEDRIAIETPAESGVLPNLFGDYDFWKNKQQASFNLRYLFKYCDGTLELPLDEKGNPMVGTFNIFRSYERQGSGDTSFILELKKLQINFKGDPLAFVPPVLDLSECDLITV